MTEPDDWRNYVVPKVADEGSHIKNAFGEVEDDAKRKDIVIVPADGGIDYMYAEGEILVREDHLERVLDILEQRTRRDLEDNEPQRIRHIIEGIVLLTLGGEHSRVSSALTAIEEQLPPGIATPNHVLTVAGGHGSSCPATEPEEVYDDIEPFPSVCHEGGAGVLIYMADTGLLQDSASHSWLEHGVRMGNPAEDSEIGRANV